MTTKAHHAAYPMSTPYGTDYLPGLTKRELFAAMAMQGYLAGRNHSASSKIYVKREVAKTCVGYADALITELSKPAEGEAPE